MGKPSPRYTIFPGHVVFPVKLCGRRVAVNGNAVTKGASEGAGQAKAAVEHSAPSARAPPCPARKGREAALERDERAPKRN